MEAIADGVGKHTQILYAYGARSMEDLGTFDAEDIEAVASSFATAGVPPLQVKRITAAIEKEVAAHRDALRQKRPRAKPDTGKRPASAPQPPTSIDDDEKPTSIDDDDRHPGTREISAACRRASIHTA